MNRSGSPNMQEHKTNAVNRFNPCRGNLGNALCFHSSSHKHLSVVGLIQTYQAPSTRCKTYVISGSLSRTILPSFLSLGVLRAESCSFPNGTPPWVTTTFPLPELPVFLRLGVLTRDLALPTRDAVTTFPILPRLPVFLRLGVLARESRSFPSWRPRRSPRRSQFSPRTPRFLCALASWR